MSKITNHAAYLLKPQAKSLEVREAPYVPPKADEISIRVHALAINPIDHILQTQGTAFAFGWLTYPLVLGSDVAGTIVEVGSSVSGFKVGDRVVGQCLGTDKGRAVNHNAEAGFQEYCILQTNVSSKIPGNVSFEQACVLPLGLSTASCGMFQKDYLNLDLPEPQPIGKKTIRRDQTLIVWGGSTSVGTNAIQLAVASGYDVVTTCSPKNFDFCLSLGASACFDYKSFAVEKEIVEALRGKICCGALAIGTNSALPCVGILASHVNPASTSSGGTFPKKFVSIMSGPEFPEPTESFATIRTISRLLTFGVSLAFKAWRNGVGWKFVFGTTLATNEVGPGIYNNFLCAALESGQFKALPGAMDAGEGLEKVQEAMDILKGGISARKVIVKLV